MFCPKHLYKLELNIIGRYLKATRDRGLVINPSPYLNIDLYPDAGFSEMYGHEKAAGPYFVKIRTGYAIIVDSLPLLWQSKLQT